MLKTFGKRAPVLASDSKFKGANIFDDKGVIQAGNRKDQFAMLAQAIQELGSGKTMATADEMQEYASDSDANSSKRMEALAAAIADETGEAKAELGREMAGSVTLYVGKVGFMRQIVKYAELNQGQIPEVDVTNRQVVAAIMQGPTQCRLQVLEDAGKIYPPEVDIEARMLVTRRRIDQSRKDVLQEAYIDAQEAILSKEDRFLKVAADALIAANGMSVTHVGQETTPATMEALVSKLSEWGLPWASAILPAARLNNIMFSREWENMIEGVSRLEILRTGTLGTFYGATLFTDATREEGMRTINSDEMYAFAPPEYVGEYTDRGGVRATPLTVAETGISGAGWHFEEALSLALPNHRAIAKLKFV